MRHVSLTPALQPVIIISLALLLRLPGCFSDFWLDEIWSLFLALKIHHPIEIFTSNHHSANQHLNTIVLYLWGDIHNWPLYRLHSLIAGTGSVLLSWLIGRQKGREEAWILATLVTTSYPLVHYSSEARGYALLIFFAFLAFYGAQRFLRQPNWLNASLIWVAVILGFTAHLTYLHVLIALTVWLIYALWQSSHCRLHTSKMFLKALLIPFLFSAAFYILVIRYFFIGAASDYVFSDVMLKTLSYMAGGPANGLWAYAAALCSIVFTLLATTWLRNQQRNEWLFFITVTALSPLAVLIYINPDVLYPRYFLVSISFALIAIGFWLASLYRGHKNGRELVLGALIIFICANSWHTWQLAKHGRGGYMQTLQWILSQTHGNDTVSITSDHDFRNKMVLDFYRTYLPVDTQRRIIYQNRDTLNAERTPARWCLTHQFQSPNIERPPIYIQNKHGHIYRLRKHFPYADLSGWHWLVYEYQQ